jgi:hypothetical protein
MQIFFFPMKLMAYKTKYLLKFQIDQRTSKTRKTGEINIFHSISDKIINFVAVSDGVLYGKKLNLRPIYC